MYYAQIKDGIATDLENALYAWDANNYCTPAALVADGKADQFGVVQVTYVSAPDHNPATHTAVRDGCEQVDGEWRYRWRVDALTPEQIEADQAAAAKRMIAEVTAATQKRLDDFARTRNYDGILSACTYATSGMPKFAAEGQYCVDARDNTWATLYAFMDDVQAGTQPMPTGFADVEPFLPSLNWP